MANVVAVSNLGPEFDIGNIQAGNIRLKIGTGLAIQPDGTIVATATLPPMAAYSVGGDGNEPNTILTLTSVRQDTGWSVATNAATYTGTPDRVRIDAMTFYALPTTATYARIAPRLQLLKNGVVVADSATGYQRHTINHNDTSYTISYTDPNPGINPTYSLRAQQGSNQNDVVDVDLGHFNLEAIV